MTKCSINWSKVLVIFSSAVQISAKPLALLVLHLPLAMYPWFGEYSRDLPVEDMTCIHQIYALFLLGLATVHNAIFRFVLHFFSSEFIYM